jgi:protein-S-isoprenylcysteine O-methyltransferase Ste14
MRASAIEFRLRVVIFLAIILLGFYAPWIEVWGIGSRISLLEWLALELSRLGLVSFNAATPIVIALAILVAVLSAALRVWGTAYLDPNVVSGARMQAGAVMADGPYRYVRNPLYLGTFFMIAALAFAMPATGAALTLILVPLFTLRLILGEERFLSGKLGEPYQAYLRAVPRLLPLLRSALPGSGNKPHWLHSLLAEINPIGILLVTVALWWRYDSNLMGMAFAICFAVSPAVRGFLLRPIPTALAVVCAALLMEAWKMPWLKAALISFGVWLILRATLAAPRKLPINESPEK